MKKSNFLLILIVFLRCAPTPANTPNQCNVLLSNFSDEISSFRIGLTTYTQMVLAIGVPTLVRRPDSLNSNYEYQLFDVEGDYCGEYIFYFAEGSCVTITTPNNVTVDDCTGILQSFSLI